MIDEKDPGRESVSADDSDDEVIIDLTDEVMIKPEDENRVLTLTEDMADNSSEVPETEKSSDPVSDEEERVLDLERSDDTRDFANMVLDTSQTSDPSDDDYEPTQYLELESEELDDIALPENEREDEPETLATPDETGELVDGGALPDIAAVSDFDFDEIDDTDDSQELDTVEPASSDEIPAGAGRTAGPPDDREAEFAGKAGSLGLDEIENFPGLNDPADVDQEMVSLTDDEPLVFEDETDAFDLEEGLDPDIDDEVIPLDGFNGTLDDQDEEIIEITDFDQHYPVEGETLLKRTGILDPSSIEEDDFLELIDLEEDALPADQEAFEFGEPPMADASESVNRFMQAELEETESQSTDSESILKDDFEDQMLQEGVSESDPEVFLKDKDAIFQEEGIDLNEEKTESSTGLPDDDSEIQSPSEDARAEIDSDEFPSVPLAQIDAAIERVITEKFSGKIEDIIYDVIEKAVAKEISRLKSALLGDNEPE